MGKFNWGNFKYFEIKNIKINNKDFYIIDFKEIYNGS
jgi:hypothetical protein